MLQTNSSAPLGSAIQIVYHVICFMGRLPRFSQLDACVPGCVMAYLTPVLPGVCVLLLIATFRLQDLRSPRLAVDEG